MEMCQILLFGGGGGGKEGGGGEAWVCLLLIAVCVQAWSGLIYLCFGDLRFDLIMMQLVHV